MGEDCRVFLMRVALPDRPGSLGAVASAMGAIGDGADGLSVERLEVVARVDAGTPRTGRRLGAHLAAHRNAGHDIPEGIEP